MRRLFRDVLLPVAIAIALAFVIQAAAAKPYEIPTPSMVPTIEPNDRVIANRLIYRFRDIERGDIIVFHPTAAARSTCNESSDVPFVKRVIGLPGDTVVVVEDGPTLVDGRPLAVPEAGPNPGQGESGQLHRRTFRVPPAKLFVLGDNRPGSCDSHQWSDPYVPEDNVIGQAEVTYWPLSSLKFLD